MAKYTIITLLWLTSVCIHGQETRWALQKGGKWRFENYLPDITCQMRNATLSATDNVAFKNNVASLANWFQQNHPMLQNPVGYDLRALANWIWSDYTTKSDAEYCIPATMGFLFEIFSTDGGKWSVEPPQYTFYINGTMGGHDGFFFTPESIVEDGTKYDLSQSGKVQEALQELTKYFRVYPLKEQPCPGVDVYEAFPGGMRKMVVFNPERPPYWLPVTVKELADAHLAYYSLFQKVEIDKMLLNQLKQEIAELTPEELAAPAYAGHDSHFVLKVNGKGQGLQIMRFNPNYWDKGLPISTIQFMTFWNACHSKEQMDEQEQRNYPDYPQLFVNQLNLIELAKYIQKK